MRECGEQQENPHRNARPPRRRFVGEKPVKRQHKQRNRKRRYQAEVLQSMRHQVRAETENKSPDQSAYSIPGNAQAKQSRAEGGQRQLQNKRKIVCNHRAGEYAERQRKKPGERIGGAPREIGARGIEHQPRMEGVVPVQQCAREMPEKPSMLEIIEGKAQQAGVERQRPGQRKKKREGETNYERETVIPKS